MKRTKVYLATILSAMAHGSGPLLATLVYRYVFGVNSASLIRVLLPVPVPALLAWSSGLAFALYVLYLDRSRIMDDMRFYAFSFWFFLFSSLLLTPFTRTSVEFRESSALTGWVLLGVFSIVDGLAGTLLQEYGVNAVGGSTASIMSAIDPVNCTALGAVFLRKPFTWRGLTGVCLIVFATVFLIGGERDQKDSKESV